MLAPLHTAAAWPHRRRVAAPHLPYFAPPLGHAVAVHPAASARARAPTGRRQPAAARTAVGQQPPRVPSPLRLARHRRCGVRGWAGTTPLPLTSGARWSVEGVGVTSRFPELGPLTSGCFLGHRLSSQTNTSLFCTLCPHWCAPEKKFPVGHPSPNFSGLSTLNLGVLLETGFQKRSCNLLT